MPVTFKYDFEKALAVLVYLASKPESVPEFDKLKAAKLLFLADKYHLVRFGRPILGDSYKALRAGPLPVRTVDYLKAVLDAENLEWVDEAKAKRLIDHLDVDRVPRYPRFSARKLIDFSEKLSKSDLAALDHIIAVHGKKSTSELVALTHTMPAYLCAWESRGEANSVDMNYEDFFEDDPDALDGALDEMLENDEMKRAFSEL